MPNEPLYTRFLCEKKADCYQKPFLSNQISNSGLVLWEFSSIFERWLSSYSVLYALANCKVGYGISVINTLNNGTYVQWNLVSLGQFSSFSKVEYFILVSWWSWVEFTGAFFAPLLLSEEEAIAMPESVEQRSFTVRGDT